MPPIFRVCFLSVVFTLPPAASANAQSFLEKLFGVGAAKKEQAETPPPMPSYRAPIHLPPSRTRSQSDPATEPHISGTIRTVCVRTCDGYYFPISYSTNARNLATDNAHCKAKCGSDSRLYYGSGNGEPDMASMVDLTGRRYDALDTAFAYRKALRPGCSCHPPPWSSAERLRHFKYALENAQSEVTQIATNDFELHDQPEAVSQPPRPSDGDASDAVTDQELAQVPSKQPTRRERTAALSRPEEAHQPRPSRAAKPARSTHQRTSNSAAPTNFNLGGIFGFGQQKKQVWPGDAR